MNCRLHKCPVGVMWLSTSLSKCLTRDKNITEITLYMYEVQNIPERGRMSEGGSDRKTSRTRSHSDRLSQTDCLAVVIQVESTMHKDS
jgi:hypothetical protein